MNEGRVVSIFGETYIPLLKIPCRNRDRQKHNDCVCYIELSQEAGHIYAYGECEGLMTAEFSKTITERTEQLINSQ